MPISTMSRMTVLSPLRASAHREPLVAVVVRRFDGHGDVVRMALLQTRSRDLHELRLLQVLDGGRTGVTHSGAQSPAELMDDSRQWTAERHSSLDALGHQFVLTQRVVLEVAVLGVRLAASRTTWALHRAQRAHAAVALELLAVDEDQLTRRLGGAGKQRAQHRGRGARGQRLGDVTGVLQ